MNTQGKRGEAELLSATDSAPRPADFPLGSLESRAAVRALLSIRRNTGSTGEGDAYPPDWSPKTAAQKAALASAADILFFGGAAGSLKTETMLVDAARESANPNLRAIIFRQQFTQMTDIVDKTHRLYKAMGATYVGPPSWTWTFPSGAKIRLAYISSDKDIWEYLGPRYSFIGFDESTFHSEYQVRNIVYKMTPAGVVTALYGFCQQSRCSDGSLPIAALVLGSDGKLYGTDEGGGTNNVGTIFRITTAGVLTTLHSFINTDGATPAAAMLQASDGNFYGTTTYGGANIACSGFFMGCGTIFKMTPAGVLTTLHSFAGAGDGNWPVGGLVQGADGSLYGTTKLGGVRNSACSFGCGTIFKITTSGTLTTLHTFDGTEAGFSTSPLLSAMDGNFYGTTGYGGGSAACAQGCGTVFQITPSGTFTILHSFGLSDGANPAGGLVQATNGILYGTTVSGGANRLCGGAYCGTVFSLDMGLGKFVETVPTAARTGAKVLILGSDLIGATAVTFNGTPATFKVVSATEITTNVPAGATTGTVQVTKPAGTLSSNVSFRVTK